MLSKKPVYEENVELPEAPVTEPSKPDVFFIKYKNQQEAEQAQQSIQGNFNDPLTLHLVTKSNCNICKYQGNQKILHFHNNNDNENARQTKRKKNPKNDVNAFIQ